MFTHGDKVCLSERGRNKFIHQKEHPHDGVGEVLRTDPFIKVKWSNGRVNYYHITDLDFAPIPAPPAPASPFFMIYVWGSGMPTVIHHTFEEAEVEAKRLSEKTKKPVYIMQSDFCVTLEVPPMPKEIPIIRLFK